METLDNDSSTGWPLGLEIMSMRLRVTETLQSVVPAETQSLRMPSPSFSSFSSSNLDTESTASFFQDHSVSLGRLLGIKPGDRSAYFSNRLHLKGREIIAVSAVMAEAENDRREASIPHSQGSCIPLSVCYNRKNQQK